MPTPLPSGEKTAFIDIVKAAPYPGGPGEADRLESILNNYEDIPMAIYRQLELFASNNSYLTRAIAVFDDAELQVIGVFNNKQSITPLADPVLIINSQYTEVTLSPASPPATLGILGNSNIGKITLGLGTDLSQLYIGPKVVVDVFDSSASVASPPVNTVLQTLWLPFMKSTPSALKMAAYQSNINQIIIDEGSFFGGIQAYDPELPCPYPVTGITATEVTKNGVFVSWTAPAGDYLFIDTYYKKTNSSVWIKADEAAGEFVNETGFVFRHGVRHIL